MVSQNISYEELLKGNNNLSAEIAKLANSNNSSLTSSFSICKQLPNSLNSLSSLTNHIKEEHSTISFSYYNTSYAIIKGITPFSEGDFHFICRKCHKVPIIEFKDSLNVFSIFCLCFKDINISLKNIIYNYIVNEDEEDEEEYVERYLKCRRHNEIFRYYCKYDQTHLCSTCLKEEYLHQKHNLYPFDFNYYDINKKKENIIEILGTQKKKMNLEINDADLLLNLFSVIFNDFCLYPNYSHFVIIDKALKFLAYFISNKNNNQIINCLGFQKRLIVNNKKMLYENMINADIIIEIDITNSNINDITQICELNFVNLEKLYLSQNSISNVEPLRRAKFKNIKNLGFGCNKIGDENIPYLLEMKFEKLKELNLYSNNLSDCNIFNLRNSPNLPNLQIFYIGNNRIDWTKSNSIDIKYNFESLKTIGLTSGIFDDKTIKYINKFDLRNLKIIYLSRSDLYSLNFINMLELPVIEEFYLNITFINEFIPLIKYKGLKIIEMKDNFIKNIDYLNSFLEELPHLKIFNIKGNNIDMNLEKNKKIIDSIKYKRNFLDIII